MLIALAEFDFRKSVAYDAARKERFLRLARHQARLFAYLPHVPDAGSGNVADEPAFEGGAS